MLKAFSIIMTILSVLSGFILFLDAVGAFVIARPFALWILFIVGALFAMGGLFSAPTQDKDYEKPN